MPVTNLLFGICKEIIIIKKQDRILINKFKDFLFISFDASLITDKQTSVFLEPCPCLFILLDSISCSLDGTQDVYRTKHSLLSTHFCKNNVFKISESFCTHSPWP
jgi:hypothetical protein